MRCQTRNRPKAALRARAVELATPGLHLRAITRQVGYRHRGTAYRAAKEVLDQRTDKAADTYRRIEQDRLSAFQVAL